MPALTRRRLVIIALLAVVLLLGGASLSFLKPDLKARSKEIRVGGPRVMVEDEFGPPRLSLRRRNGGHALVWVDLLWQLTVLVDGEGRVESVAVSPVDSFYRRPVGRIIPLPK